MQSPNLQNYYNQYYNNFSQPTQMVHHQYTSSYLNYNPHHGQFRKNHSNYEEHWCETCDRSFPSLDVLDKHKQQHQKCNIDGCQFIAHPKVITKHIQMQHSSGLYQKISKLNNPEEIQKWRDERKRKYPTKDNVEKKKAEIKEKIERGEKMGLRQFKHRNLEQVNRANRTNSNGGRKYQRGQRKKPFPLMLTRKSAVPKKIHDVLPSAGSTQVLKPFAGIQDIAMEDTPEESNEQIECDFIIDDDETLKLTEPDKTPTELLQEPKVCGALSSLMCNYETSEDESENSTDQPPPDLNTKIVQEVFVPLSDKLVNSTEIIPNSTPSVENQNNSDDDDGPEETKIDKEEMSRSSIEERPKLVKPQPAKQNPVVNNRNRHNFVKPKHKIPSTLLQKLLKSEVQHERNIILQCVRHVVSNNFFDMPNINE